MSIQLYMDEQVPRQITVGLRLRDIDVLTVQEDNFAGLSDLEIINRATQLSRVLFSRDDDLLVIAKDYQKRGRLHKSSSILTIVSCESVLPIQPRKDGKAKVYQVQQFLNYYQGNP